MPTAMLFAAKVVGSSSRISAISTSDIPWVHAPARASASGRPSTARQMRPAVASSASVRLKVRLWRLACCTNRRNAGLALIASGSASTAGASRLASVTTHSAGTRSVSREVTTTINPGQYGSRRASEDDASRRCSQPSRISSWSRAPIERARAAHWSPEGGSSSPI